ncbi:uncharacterized protein Z518_03442 [Rhinocladiella mackenziei CBS 650.93]|uniref:Rhinocladiella mackenziei CBS 650.93 unplaced genomic scaffold supercont1.2, whole genome shotgun sequence n=1 Tax=Rhinocladiella mackenziei CBS 650.93 TaxID=1442369 RepID=A0A0D2JHF4_9EURO|nr:uncharacterized protein Z518_03442 [Rhinocladiella mackenziei CBS 650.93]KIX08785.1 hypothetical protein Z518_03442 [Rhinocladiella mackenziei CBS 650.93]
MSPRTHTPPSDSDPSMSRQCTPSTSNASQSASVPVAFDPDPDIPLPSIEGEPDLGSSLTAHNNSTPRARTPSFSISPPTSEENTSFPPSVSPTYGANPPARSQISGIGERVGNLVLSGESATRQSSSRETISTPSRSGQDHSSSRLTTPTNEGYSPPGSTIDGIAGVMANVQLGSKPRSPTPGNYLDPRSPSPGVIHRDGSRSPRSASRRRSGSHVDQTPHNVADEEPPHERFHEPEFQRELAHSRDLVGDLVNILASSSLHNESESRIRTLYLQAVDLSRFQHPSTRTVGLVGDSGVGKSSLLNSLLDFEGFARTSNSGAACTCVATEYHYHEHNSFALEIEYFTLDELREQLTELLQSYRHYHLREPDDNRMTADERHELEEKAKTAQAAQDTFRAAFRDHLAHSDRFLLDEPEENVVQTLLTWAMSSGLPLTKGPGGNPRKEVFDDARKCSDHLMGLTSEPISPNEPSKWPFIRKIKVYLNAYILSKGLILVDLPGLRDLNAARLRITERYLLKCDEIFAICYIGRATTDAGVEGVFKLARRASLSRIGIICTKSDDILADEAQRDWEGDTKMKISNMTREIGNLQTDLDTIEAEISELSFDSDAVDDEENQQLRRLTARSRKIKLKNYLITTRNQRVTDALQTMYQNQIPRADLPVFCVSNVDYWEHRARPKVESWPFLCLSGIPEVRKHCLSLVAASQLHAATEYVTNAIPALLGSVELWVQSGSGSVSAERKQAIRNALDEIERELDTVSFYGKKFSRMLVHFPKKKVHYANGRAVQRSDQWSRAALNATSEWEGWHPNSYSAFCRNYGNYSTIAAGSHCWNVEATQTMITQMATPWQAFHQNLLALQANLSRTIEGSFDRAIAQSNATSVPTGSLRTLTATLRHRQAMLVSHVDKLGDEFQDDISILQTDLFSGIRSSFVGQLMEPSYNTCKNDSGRGSDARRKSTMRQGFGSNQLFPNIRRKFRNRISELSRDLDHQIQEAIATHLTVVQRDLDTLRNENVALESESHPEFRRRLEEAVHRIREQMESALAVFSPLRLSTAGTG